MTTAPSWLYHLFAVLMLAVAAYCLTLLILSVKERRMSGWDVDIAHVCMGVSMAGMFITAWAFGPAWAWELLFFVLMIWFIARSIQSVQEFGLHLPHYAVHALMSFAMLMMYVFPGATRAGSSPSMGMSAAGGSRLDPGLALLLAFSFFASAIFTLASPRKGAIHHGTHVPEWALVGAVDEDGDDGSSVATLTNVGTFDRIVATPWLEDVSHVVMCVAMGLMLILMI
jgi:hypothetical protein